MSTKSPRCPVELTLNILGGKWKTVILAHIKESPRRYRDLRELIPDLSEKMLTQRLSDLEEEGTISRRVTDENVTHYELTARGQSLGLVLQALYDWGVAHGSAEATGNV